MWPLIKSGINKGKLPKVDPTLLPPLLSEVAAKVGITLSKVKVGTIAVEEGEESLLVHFN